jgi:hypothetical protein
MGILPGIGMFPMGTGFAFVFWANFFGFIVSPYGVVGVFAVIASANEAALV